MRPARVPAAVRALLRVAAAVTFLIGPAASAHGQDALALGGGGSRGLAHAGVLAGLEQLGYSPAIVAGTSMGAVIGALYAAGLSADSIAHAAIDQNWIALFSPFEPAIGPELAPRVPLLQLRLGSQDPRSATGLISDWRINRRLVRLLFDAGARARSDFDRLPRRFRAVAADLRSGEAVVVGSGDLARAVRASMAVPGVFAPLVDDDRVLVDGGIVSYLPVMAARQLGAGRVIAVDVIRPPAEIRGTDPFTLILRGFRLTLANTIRDVPPPEVLIVPDIPQRVSAAYFSRSPERLITIGLEAALAQLPPIEPPVRAARAAAAAPGALRALEVEAGPLAALVRAEYAAISPGAYHADAVLSAADRLYATGRFTGVWPRVETRADGDVLVVHADAVPATRLAVAAALDTDRGPHGWASAQHRPRAGPVELSVAISAGSFDKLLALAASAPVVAIAGASLTAGAAWRERDLRIFEDSRHTGEADVVRAGGWVGLEWRDVGRDLHAALTIRGEHIRAEDAAQGFATGPFFRLGRTGTPARIVGAPFRFEAEARFGEVAYRRAEVSGSLDAAAGGFLMAAAARVALAGGDAPLDALGALGDHHAMPALRWGRGRDRAVALGGVEVAHALVLGGYLRLRGRTGFAAGALDGARTVRWTTGAEAGLVWETPLGGAALALGITNRGDERFLFTIGPEY